MTELIPRNVEPKAHSILSSKRPCGLLFYCLATVNLKGPGSHPPGRFLLLSPLLPDMWRLRMATLNVRTRKLLTEGLQVRILPGEPNLCFSII